MEGNGLGAGTESTEEGCLSVNLHIHNLERTIGLSVYCGDGLQACVVV